MAHQGGNYKVPSIMQRKLSHKRALPEHEIIDRDAGGLNQGVHTLDSNTLANTPTTTQLLLNSTRLPVSM